MREIRRVKMNSQQQIVKGSKTNKRFFMQMRNKKLKQKQVLLGHLQLEGMVKEDKDMTERLNVFSA